jgi:HSP20 family protein
VSPFGVFSRLAILAWPLLPGRDEDWGAPPLDIYETRSDLVIELELPGTRADEIRVSCEGDMLVIEGKTGETLPRGPAEVSRFHCVERASGPFRRRVRLPATVLGERASARLSDGVLTVRVPKTAGERTP